jgi:hypothetical protein
MTWFCAASVKPNRSIFTGRKARLVRHGSGDGRIRIVYKGWGRFAVGRHMDGHTLPVGAVIMLFLPETKG